LTRIVAILEATNEEIDSLRDSAHSSSVCDNHECSKQRKMDLFWHGFVGNLLGYPYDAAHHDA
jgi:hypothetical protein